MRSIKFKNEFKSFTNCNSNEREALLSKMQRTRYANRNNVLHEIILVIATFKSGADFSIYLKYFSIFLSKYNHLIRQEDQDGRDVISFLALCISGLDKKRDAHYDEKVKLLSEALAICCIVGEIKILDLMEVQCYRDRYCASNDFPSYNFLKALEILARSDVSYMNLIVVYILQNPSRYAGNTIQRKCSILYQDMKNLAEMHFYPAKLGRTFNLQRHLVNLKCDYYKSEKHVTDKLPINKEIDNLFFRLLKLHKEYLMLDKLQDKFFDALECISPIGVDINFCPRDGYTPLMLAVEYNDDFALKNLARLGAKLNVKNHCGQTALILAVELNHLDSLEALIWLGADVSVKDKKGKDALEYAVDGGDAKIVKQLLLAGAELGDRIPVLYSIASPEILQILQAEQNKEINRKSLRSADFDIAEYEKQHLPLVIASNELGSTQSRFFNIEKAVLEETEETAVQSIGTKQKIARNI